MTKYGIRLQNGKGDLLKNFSEHTGKDNAKPITFDSISEANEYAQNYEIKSYEVEKVE